MQVSGEMKNNAFVVTLNGRMDMETSSEFNARMEKYIEENETPILLNCRELKYINSSGLTSFIHVSQMLESLNQKFFLCELQPPILEVIEIAGMTTYFKTFPTEKEALENL